MTIQEKVLTYLENYNLGYKTLVNTYSISSVALQSGTIYRITFTATISGVTAGHYVYVTIGANEGYHLITNVGSNYVDFDGGAVQGALGAGKIYSVSMFGVNQSIQYTKNYIQQITGLSFEGAENITEYHDGSGTEELILNRKPVNSLVSIDVLSTPQYLFSIPIGNVEVLSDLGMLRIKNTNVTSFTLYSPYFPEGRNNIKIVYNAGFADYPSALQDALVMMTVGKLLQDEASLCGGEVSLTVVSYSVNYEKGKWKTYQKSLYQQAQAILRKYKTGIVA